MGRAVAERAVLVDGLTLREVAEALSVRLGFEVTAQQVHYLAKRLQTVEIGRVVIVVPRRVEVDAIHPDDVDVLESVARQRLTEVPE